MTDGARPENRAKAKEIIDVLKQHPDGMPRGELAKAVNIENGQLAVYFSGLLKYEPIGYDGTISDLVYWVGV